MPAKWRVQITLTSGAQIYIHATDIDIKVDSHGALRDIDYTPADGPRLAFVKRSEVAAIVLEEES